MQYLATKSRKKAETKLFFRKPLPYDSDHTAGSRLETTRMPKLEVVGLSKGAALGQVRADLPGVSATTTK
jgi:hypothetical protein